MIDYPPMQDVPIQGCPNDHTTKDHWREDTYGAEFRIQCDCDCPACQEY